MPRIRVTGDVLRAFVIEFNTPVIGDDDELREQVAAQLGLTRFGQEEGLIINNVEEVEHETP